MVLFLVTLVATFVVAELSLERLVRRLRTRFKWLVTEVDELPRLDPVGLAKFLENGFDPDLGWTKRAGSSGIEKGRGRVVEFTIDESGSRALPFRFEAPPEVAVFGDSYAFCRQVGDAETWEAQLSQLMRRPVLNFGVGNYGADQALLRYERSRLPLSVRRVVLAFVPETICRVQSYWKHYLEFGNTFAFKPRFRLEGGRLQLLPNLMRSPEDFARYEVHLPAIQADDLFYRSKFRRLQFRFPYLWSLWRAPTRHFGLIFRLLKSRQNDSPFESVMRGNIQDAHRLYEDGASRRLLSGILERFVVETGRRGHEPLILVLPQMIDVSIAGGTHGAYRAFFKDLAGRIPVVDFTEQVVAQPDLAALYTEDLYGGHFSPLGNRLVADHLYARWN